MNRTLYKILLTVISLFIPSLLCAQFYTAGNDPGSARWRQIKTEHYTVIYPQEIDSLARRYASLLENCRAAVMEPLNIDPKHIPVVLHPYTTMSNGVVTWAPKRMDLFTTPPAYEDTPENWAKSLVVHESRHVGQVSHFEKGVYKYLYWFIGEQAPGIGVGLYPSTVFLEGDAVIAETELSNAGRGRYANFLMYSRAAYLNNDFRNWDRLRFGSYKYFTPDHYVLGYILNTAIRYQTGSYNYSSHYLNYLVKNFYNPNVIFITYHNITGKTRNFLLNKGQQIFSESWNNDLLERGVLTQSTPVVNKETKLYSNYRYSTPIRNPESKYDGSILALKNGMEYSKVLIAVDSTGKEHTIRPFNSYSSPLSIGSDGILYWTETVSHEAGQLEDFSELKSFNTKTGRYRTIKFLTKWFNPTVSASGDTVAVVEYPVEGSSYLVLLTGEKKKECFRVEAPEKGQLKEPVFVGGDIYCSAILEEGLGIYKLEDGGWKEIIPQHNSTIVGLKSYDEKGFYFSSDLDGVNNIYYYNIADESLERLTNSKYGASDPYIIPSENTLYYSEYSTMGYKLGKDALDTLNVKKMSFSHPHKRPVAEMITEQAKESALFEITDTIDISDQEKYPSKKYNKLTHLFRVHSWAPVYYNVDNIKSMSYDQFYDLASVGATVYSQNTLGTAVSMLGYSYHNGFHSGHFKFDYSGWQTTVEASVDFNDRDICVYDLVKVVSDGGYRINTYTKQHSPYLRTNLLLYLPISLATGGWNKGFIPQLSWQFTNDKYFSVLKNKYVFKHQINYGLRFYQTLPIPTSAIYPRWGFGFSLNGSSVPKMDEFFGNLLYSYVYLYSPGITRQQGLKITGTYQKQFLDNNIYYLSSYASLPRGYQMDTPTADFVKVTADYAIPIYLGDVNLGSIIYLKRLQLIPFGDYAWDRNDKGTASQYYSFGSDVLLDCYLFRFNIPISVGLRYARTGAQQGNRNYFNMLFSISI